MTIDKKMEITSELVIKAGKMIKDSLGGNYSTNCKSSPADLVTDVDRSSQLIIVEGLKKSFPDHRFVAEEDFNEAGFHMDDRPVWFIDPLDGTTNFVFGIPFFAVNVALSENGELVMGLTYDPVRKELFTAVKGRGAFLNGTAVKVDGHRDKLDKSLITTGFPAVSSFKDQMWAANYKNIFYKSLNVRSLGAAALELAYIACGRLTGYWEVKLRPWDVAAGMLLVKEAGGRITDLQGNCLELADYISFVASNGLIHDELLANLEYKKDRSQ